MSIGILLNISAFPRLHPLPYSAVLYCSMDWGRILISAVLAGHDQRLALCHYHIISWAWDFTVLKGGLCWPTTLPVKLMLNALNSKPKPAESFCGAFDFLSIYGTLPYLPPAVMLLSELSGAQSILKTHLGRFSVDTGLYNIVCMRH